jgi:malonyl-CoA O-methyltransferase
MNSAHLQFSKYSHSYDEHNVIQKEVCIELLKNINDSPKKILDIGCGTGLVYKNMNWNLDLFVGTDHSEEMLLKHPKKENVILSQIDFNKPSFLSTFNENDFDRVVSSSALQWSSDLENNFKEISSLNTPVSLSVFTSGTFKTLYQLTGLKDLLPKEEVIVQLAQKYFDAKIYTKTYSLKFDSVREMFRYMKKSGVSAGNNTLSIKDLRSLLKNYPLDHLEFEVVFIHSD